MITEDIKGDTMSYNLLEEKWIPILWKDGNFDRVGIVDAFAQAERIRQIAASNPMDRVAILRFLLALLYWCQGNPPELLPDKSFPRDWFKKLEDTSTKECFNLLGNGKRFYQDNTAQRQQAVTQLIQEIPSGNNFSHFRHSTDMKQGLCPACCAMGLVRLPLYSVSGLSGPGEPNLMAGINGVPPVYIVPWGKTLMETLKANWVRHNSIGEPSWVQPDISHIQDDVPLLYGLTLLSRRVFLHDPVKDTSTCLICGEKAELILTCEFKTAGKQENEKWNDPHIVYADDRTRKAMRSTDLTAAGKFRMDRPWPELIARIAEGDKPTPLLVVGFATDKAKNIDAWERIVTLRQDQRMTSFVRQWQQEGRGLEKIIDRSKVTWAAAIASIRPHVENSVSEQIDKLISGDEADWVQAAGEYGLMMDAIAKSLSPGFTSATLQRRKQIAAIKPNMQQKTKAPKMSNLKKGGDK